MTNWGTAGLRELCTFGETAVDVVRYDKNECIYSVRLGSYGLPERLPAFVHLRRSRLAPSAESAAHHIPTDVFEIFFNRVNNTPAPARRISALEISKRIGIVESPDHLLALKTIVSVDWLAYSCHCHRLESVASAVCCPACREKRLTDARKIRFDVRQTYAINKTSYSTGRSFDISLFHIFPNDQIIVILSQNLWTRELWF